MSEKVPKMVSVSPIKDGNFTLVGVGEDGKVYQFNASQQCWYELTATKG